jgi:CRISPR-associated protein Csm1
LEFRKLSGDPWRTWGLSRLLDDAFSSAVARLLKARFPNLYPVYGRGDDLFVIGPWNDVVDFAAAWRSEFRAISGNNLTFSAGIALAKPRQHILSKSEEAEHALNEHAKGPRDSIHALGATIPWSEFDDVRAGAGQLAAMHAGRQIKSALLHNIIDLHDRWQKGDERWHSLLFYQLERNLTGEAKSFVRRAFLSPGHLWKHAGFAVRYAMLHTAGEERN